MGPFRLTHIPLRTLVLEQPEGKVIGVFAPVPVTLYVAVKRIPFVGAMVG